MMEYGLYEVIFLYVVWISLGMVLVSFKPKPHIWSFPSKSWIQCWSLKLGLTCCIWLMSMEGRPSGLCPPSLQFSKFGTGMNSLLPERVTLYGVHERGGVDLRDLHCEGGDGRWVEFDDGGLGFKERVRLGGIKHLLLIYLLDWSVQCTEESTRFT